MVGIDDKIGLFKVHKIYTVPADVASVTFSGLDLSSAGLYKIFIAHRCSAFSQLRLQINGDSTFANYLGVEWLFSTGTSNNGNGYEIFSNFSVGPDRPGVAEITIAQGVGGAVGNVTMSGVCVSGMSGSEDQAGIASYGAVWHKTATNVTSAVFSLGSGVFRAGTTFKIYKTNG